jgi:hypothetical protein
MTEPALAGATLRVVGTTTTIPAFFRADAALHDDLGALAQQRQRTNQVLLARAGVASTRLAAEATVLRSIVDLLERQRLFGTGSNR